MRAICTWAVRWLCAATARVHSRSPSRPPSTPPPSCLFAPPSPPGSPWRTSRCVAAHVGGWSAQPDNPLSTSSRARPPPTVTHVQLLHGELQVVSGRHDGVPGIQIIPADVPVVKRRHRAGRQVHHCAGGVEKVLRDVPVISTAHPPHLAADQTAMR